MTSNSRMGEFFSVSVGERGAVALGWSGAEDLYWWEYEMTSTLGSDIRKNINQARAIYSLLKFRNGLQRHMGICVTGVYADMLITQNLGSILPPGTTSSPWPSLSLPYCSLLVYKTERRMSGENEVITAQLVLFNIWSSAPCSGCTES